MGYLNTFLKVVNILNLNTILLNPLNNRLNERINTTANCKAI